MFEKLRIRGFQTHTDLTIEFGQITTIQGPTDAGKSAILRALKWLAVNRPAGDAFRRAGAKSAAVDLRVDGKIISRRKGKKNTYKLDGKTFAAIGGRVPDEIATLLNIGDTNFAGQFDPPFWLADSPGAVSRNLNAIVDLGIIDDTLSAVAARLRKSAATVEISRERLAAARGEREKLAWVPDFVEKLGALEGAAAEIAQKRLDCRTLRSLIADVETAETSRRAAGAGITAATNALAAGKRWAAAERRAAGLRDLIGGLEAAEIETANTARWAEQAAANFKRKTKGKACPLCQKII